MPRPEGAEPLRFEEGARALLTPPSGVPSVCVHVHFTVTVTVLFFLTKRGYDKYWSDTQKSRSCRRGKVKIHTLPSTVTQHVKSFISSVSHLTYLGNYGDFFKEMGCISTRMNTLMHGLCTFQRAKIPVDVRNPVCCTCFQSSVRSMWEWFQCTLQALCA